MTAEKVQSPKQFFTCMAMLLVMCILCGCSESNSSSEASNFQSLSSDAPKTKQDFGNVRILVYGNAEDDAELFSEKQNEVFQIASELLDQQRGVRMKLSFLRSDQPFQGGDKIDDRLAVMVSAGDPPEIVYRYFPQNFELMNNTLLPYRLNDIIEEYGSNLINFLPKSDWEHCKVGDDILGIPSSRRFRPQLLTVNNALLKQYNWQVPNTFSEFELLLADAKAANLQPLPSFVSLENWFGQPGFSYTTLLYEAEGGELKPCYESENYLRYVETMHRWAVNDYFASDAADAPRASDLLFDNINAAGDVTLVPPLAATDSEPLTRCFYFPYGHFEAYNKPDALVMLVDWVLGSPENYKLMIYGQQRGAASGNSAGLQQTTSLRTDCFFNQEMNESIRRTEDYDYARRMDAIADYQDRADQPPPLYKLPNSCWRFARPESELWMALRSQMEYEGAITYEWYRCIYEKKPVDYFRAALLENKPLILQYIKLVTLYKQGIYDPKQDMIAPQS